MSFCDVGCNGLSMVEPPFWISLCSSLGAAPLYIISMLACEFSFIESKPTWSQANSQSSVEEVPQ